MRRVVGVGLMLVAVVALIGGSAMAILFGPDNRATTGPHEIETDAPVVTTTPEVLDWVGPTVTVTAQVPDDQQVFVGAAQAVDVADYVGSTRRTEVTDLGLPWEITTADVEGDDRLPAAPGALDWWVVQGSGQGSASVTFELPDQALVLAIVAGDQGDLTGLEVTASYDLNGGFGIGLGVAGFSIGLGIFGWIAWQERPIVRGGKAGVEEQPGEEQTGEEQTGEEQPDEGKAGDEAQPDEQPGTPEHVNATENPKGGDRR